MNMEICVKLAQLLCISITIFLIVLCVGIFLIISKYLDNKLILENLRLDLAFSYNNEMSIIDSLIQNEIDSYKLYNIISKNILYVNEEEQQKMIYTCLKNVLESISPHLMNKLYYIYNSKKIEDVICEKVKQQVLETCIDINSSSDTKNKK